MLESRARARSGSVAEAMRSKILSLAAGNSQAQTSRTVGCSVNTVRLWKERFLGERLGGLYGRHRGRSRSKESIRLEARVLRLAQRKPADGSTHWSTRKIAVEVGTNHVRVTRILVKAGRQPHRLRRYLSSNDPEFEEKAADIIGLYLKLPVHAAVFCVDEKSAIQALDRLDPVLPLSPGRAERHGFEYYRHGTLSLFAVKSSAEPLPAIPARSSWLFSSRSLPVKHRQRKFTSSPTISRPIVPPRSGNSSTEILMSASITHRPTPRGSIKLRSGFPKSNGMSSLAASSSRSKIAIGSSSATSVATTKSLNLLSGLTPKLKGAFTPPRNHCNAALVSIVGRYDYTDRGTTPYRN
jgi:transposase